MAEHWNDKLSSIRTLFEPGNTATADLLKPAENQSEVKLPFDPHLNFEFELKIEFCLKQSVQQWAFNNVVKFFIICVTQKTVLSSGAVHKWRQQEPGGEGVINAHNGKGSWKADLLLEVLFSVFNH